MLGAVPCWPTLLAGLLGVGLPTAASAQLEHPLVGAIRWDAWHGELEAPGLAVERALAPLQYRSRLPWFTEFREDGTPSIRCDGPGVIEGGSQYALEAGIDYWSSSPTGGSALSIPAAIPGGEWRRPALLQHLQWFPVRRTRPLPPVVERLLGYFAVQVRGVLGDRPCSTFLCHGDERHGPDGVSRRLRVAVDALAPGRRARTGDRTSW